MRIPFARTPAINPVHLRRFWPQFAPRLRGLRSGFNSAPASIAGRTEPEPP